MGRPRYLSGFPFDDLESAVSRGPTSRRGRGPWGVALVLGRRRTQFDLPPVALDRIELAPLGA